MRRDQHNSDFGIIFSQISQQPGIVNLLSAIPERTGPSEHLGRGHQRDQVLFIGRPMPDHAGEKHFGLPWSEPSSASPPSSLGD
jgi:hypothetical protein